MMATVLVLLETRSGMVAVTTQQPQPPSAHILFVPESPGCKRNHSFRVNLGLALSTITARPFRENDTEVLGNTLLTAPISHYS